jgi:hypothetical protein
MKKTLLAFAVVLTAGYSALAQTVIHDNGPLIDMPGAGVGGADVSSLHDGMTSYGSGHAVSSGYRVADDLIVPAGESWVIDSLVFFAYQTNSGNTSSITEVNVRIWDGVPGTGNIVYGDDVTNRMITTEWTGIYRTDAPGSTTCDPATCSLRPIMRNATMIGTTLAAGTYWIDWQTNGTLTSGPWAPPINLGTGVTTTGNAMQYDPATLIWNNLFDGGLTTEAQGLPYLAVGTVITSINEITQNNSVSVFPNPMNESATVTINVPVSKNDALTFTLYDILGNEVLKMNNISTKQFNLERGTLTNGVYMYEMLKSGDVLKKGKIVLQ